MLKWKEKFNRN